MSIVEAIAAGKTALGIELGSTRIKAVLIGEDHHVLANGSFSWENRLENDRWTYHLDDAVRGLQESFADLAADVKGKYGVELTKIGAIGISGIDNARAEALMLAAHAAHTDEQQQIGRASCRERV